MAKKKPKRKTLKAKLDRMFSQYIRMRFADENGYALCITCGKLDHWKNMDCGHFITRTFLTTRWSDINCQVQCPKCNRYLEGQKDAFATYLIENYGINILKNLTVLKNSVVKHTDQDYLEMIDMYKGKIDNLALRLDLTND